ncbi:hypothetical protein IT413_00170 [Candidatus Peregrinibacteria bacterium]|nr:hypothetical protein [Candidatus Peregrinibacteria bacterium]
MPEKTTNIDSRKRKRPKEEVAPPVSARQPGSPLVRNIQSISQRLILGAVAITAATVGSIYIDKSPNDPTPAITAKKSGGQISKTPQSKKTPSEGNAKELSDEETTDILIEKAEKGLASYEERLRTKTAVLKDEYLKDSLLKIFDTLRKNKNNPNRNIPRLVAKMMKSGERSMEAPIEFFGYAPLLDESENAAAAFNPKMRTMSLDPNFDPENDLELSILYHEARHSLDDMKYRSLFANHGKLGEYMQFIKSPGTKPILSAEAMAFATQIESVDLLTDGQLRKTQITDRESMAKLHQTLRTNMKTSDISSLNILVKAAQVFYPHGLKNGEVSEEFADHIAGLYGQFGPVYMITADAKIVPYKRTK